LQPSDEHSQSHTELEFAGAIRANTNSRASVGIARLVRVMSGIARLVRVMS